MDANQELTAKFLLDCRNDFSYFCKHVLDYEITNYHRELMALPMQHRYLCVVIPTGHSKTWTFSIAYPLWRLFREQSIEICLVSSSLDQSMKIFSQAQYVLETNPFFQTLLPKNRHISWTKSFIKTTNNNQYYIKPFNSTARGIHPHYIIMDDLLREGDMPMDQVKETFWTIFFPRGQIHNCQLIVVGTPQSIEDLYADIERRGKDNWKVVRKSAIIEDETGKPISVLWKERFSLEKLEGIREQMGDPKFQREYMCKPVSEGELLIPKEMILNAMDYNLEFSEEIIGTVVLGCDFAMSTAKSGDYNAFLVIDDASGTTYTKHTDKGDVEIKDPVFIRNMIRYRGGIGQTQRIKDLYQRYKALQVVVDNSGVGAKFVQELRDEFLNVDAQDFQPAKRNMLLMNMRRVFEQNRLIIPGGEASSPMTDILIRELGGFRLNRTKAGHESWKSDLSHDDSVFGLAMAVKNVSSNPQGTGENFIIGV